MSQQKFLLPEHVEARGHTIPTYAKYSRRLQSIDRHAIKITLERDLSAIISIVAALTVIYLL